MKKWITLLLSIVMITVLAVGCGPSATDESGNDETVDNTADASTEDATDESADESAKEVTLTYQTTAATDMITTAFAEYQKTHPNVKLEVQVVDNSEINTKLLAQASTNTLTDFGWNNGSQFVDIYRQTEAVMDLTDIINNDIGTDKFVADTFTQMTADGHIVAFPAEMQIQGFLINTAVFDQLGLDIPTNYAELLNCAKVFKENGLVLFGSGTGDTWPTWTWYYWLQLWGVEDLKTELFVDHTINWADSDPVKMYYKLAELREAGAFAEFNSTITYEQSKTMLLAGQCGVIPTSTDQLGGITGSEQDLAGDIKYWFGIEFEDSPYNQKYAVKVVNNGYGVRADLEEEKLEVLIDFFKFFYSADGANTVITDGLMLPITDEITADITPLTKSIVELTQDPARVAVTGASYSWWNSWNLRFDCEPALNGFHLEGHEVLMNGLIDGSMAKEDIPVYTEKMDEAITETLEWLKDN